MNNMNKIALKNEIDKKESRMDSITPFYVMEILEKAKEIEHKIKLGVCFPFPSVIHLEVGEPDFSSPDCVKESAIDSIRSGNEKYTHSLGDIKLRKAIADDYKKRHGIIIDPERIVAGSGTSPLLLCLCIYLLQKGDEVIIFKPYYSGYPNFIRSLGAKPVFLETDPTSAFEPNIIDIQNKITDKTKAVLINSPSNPTGYVFSSENMRSVAEISEKTKIPIISDEIYQGIVYEGAENETILKYTDNAFVLNGFSKYYCMTGWRLGYMIVPKKSVRDIQKLMQNFFISVNSFVQEAGVKALQSPEENRLEMVDTYGKRRNYMAKKLKEIGFKIPHLPAGAFYIFADARPFTNDSLEFVIDILEKTGVACTPGIDFGQEGYVRFSYANSTENIKEAMNRLEAYLKNKK